MKAIAVCSGKMHGGFAYVAIKTFIPGPTGRLWKVDQVLGEYRSRDKAKKLLNEFAQDRPEIVFVSQEYGSLHNQPIDPRFLEGHIMAKTPGICCSCATPIYTGDSIMLVDYLGTPAAVHSGCPLPVGTTPAKS